MNKSELQKRLESFSLLDAPGHLLRRNHQRSYEIFTRVVGDDITRQQMALLVVLAKKPGASQRDLVDATGIDKSTLKEMIGRMVTKGWMSRKKDPEDSRAWTMRITLAGEDVVAARFDDVQKAQQEIIAPLPEKDRAAFMRSLRILAGLETAQEED